MNSAQVKKNKRSKGGRFLPALCSIIGTLMLLAVIVTCLPLTVPKWMGYEIYNVVSPSMYPAIPMGSVIYVEPTAPESIEAGDVIAFHGERSIITHRVVRNQIVEGQFVTKGDANAKEDINPVLYREMVGKVVYHIPFIGQLLMLYTNQVAKLYVLTFAACGLILNILASRMRDRRRQRQQELEHRVVHGLNRQKEHE